MEFLSTCVEHQLRRKVTPCLSSIKKCQHQTDMKLGTRIIFLFVYCLGVLFTRDTLSPDGLRKGSNMDLRGSSGAADCLGRWRRRVVLKKRGALHLARGRTTKHKHPQPAALELLAFSCATITKLWVFAKKRKKKKCYHSNDCIQNKCNKVVGFAERRSRIESRGGKCSGSGPPSGELAEKGILSFQKGELHSGYRS